MASKEPSGTHIFPAGGRRGTTVQVRVGGECLPPGSSFHVLGTRLSAPARLGPRARGNYEPSPRRTPSDADGGEQISYPKEWQSQITIAADAPLGVAAWRVTCGWGGTQPRPFIVGELPEFIETEPNSAPERAERVTLPVTVNGQVAGERDVDCFVCRAEKGDVVVCDVLAGRLGSPLDPVLEVRDARGRRVPLQEVRVGGDPVVAFRAGESGDYTLSVANVSYRGGPEYVYRMTVSNEPFIAFAFPTGRDDEVQTYALTGGYGYKVGFASRAELRLFSPSPPASGGEGRGEGGYARQRSGENPLTPIPSPPKRERGEHNPADGTPSCVIWDEAAFGRFLTATAEDSYSFLAKAGEAFTLDGRPFGAASLACPVVTLEDAAGRPLARVSGADTADRGCRLDWKAPGDGTYRVRVRDLQHGSRGGPEFIYRLSLQRARPSFTLTLSADYVNVVQGGKSEIDLVIDRSGGFTGPIEMEAGGLPADVRLETPRVPANVTRFKLVFAAADDARPASAAMRLHGVAPWLHRAQAQSTPVGGAYGVMALAGRGDALHLTVQHKPIFKLTCNEAYQYAHRGTVYPYALQVERLNGFDGPITLQIADRQVQDLDGIDVVERVVPPGVKAIAALVYLPETMNANAQHHSRPYVQGHATFTDKWGQKQAMLALCEKRCMIRAMPAVAKLKAAEEHVTYHPGAPLSVRLLLARTANFSGPMDVELVEAPPRLTLETTRFETGQTEATAVVRLADGTSICDGQTLRFRATGHLAGEGKVVSETSITLNTRR